MKGEKYFLFNIFEVLLQSEKKENVWFGRSERLDGFQRGAGSNPVTFKFIYVFLLRKKLSIIDKVITDYNC